MQQEQTFELPTLSVEQAAILRDIVRERLVSYASNPRTAHEAELKEATQGLMDFAEKLSAQVRANRGGQGK